jgi:hypothetical protein
LACDYRLGGINGQATLGLRFAAYLGTVLFAVAISAVLLRIVSVEYWRDPVTGWYIWASGTAFVLLGH